MRPHRRQPTRLPRPWDSPGKNTGVGCHFLLQRMKVTRESEVAQSCLTLSHPVDHSLPGSSSMRFSRQEYWSGVPLPFKRLLGHKSKFSFSFLPFLPFSLSLSFLSPSLSPPLCLSFRLPYFLSLSFSFLPLPFIYLSSLFLWFCAS